MRGSWDGASSAVRSTAVPIPFTSASYRGRARKPCLLYTSDTKDILPLLSEMQTAHDQIVVVVDEYGGCLLYTSRCV